MVLDARTAIALLEQKRISDEEQRMAPSVALAKGVEAGVNRSINKADEAGKRQFELWQTALKDYSLSKMDGAPLDAQELNVVNNYIAANNDLPPGIKLQPKQTGYYIWDKEKGGYVPSGIPAGGKPVNPPVEKLSMGSMDITKYLIDPTKADAQGQDLLNNIKPQYKQMIQGIIDYKAKPSDIASTRGEAANLYALASNIKGEPIDSTVYNQKYKTAQDFSPNGRSGRNIVSLNTAIGHLDSLMEAAKGLDNSKIRKYNTLGNWLKNETGNPAVARFKAAENAVAGEMATVFKGTAGTDQEISSWKSTMDSSQSPEQARATIEQMIDLIKSRVDTIGGQWYSLMQDKPIEIIYPKSKKTLLKHGYDENLMKISGNNEPQSGGLPIGTIDSGYKYIGGDPANPNSWEKQ